MGKIIQSFDEQSIADAKIKLLKHLKKRHYGNNCLLSVNDTFKPLIIFHDWA